MGRGRAWLLGAGTHMPLLILRVWQLLMQLWNLFGTQINMPTNTHTHSHTYMPKNFWEISRIWWSCCQAEILAKDNAVSTPTDRGRESERKRQMGRGQVPSAFINHSSTRFARLYAMPPRSQELLMDGRRGCQMALAEWPSVSGIYALSGPQLKSTFKGIITINILL